MVAMGPARASVEALVDSKGSEVYMVPIVTSIIMTSVGHCPTLGVVKPGVLQEWHSVGLGAITSALGFLQDRILVVVLKVGLWRRC